MERWFMAKCRASHLFNAWEQHFEVVPTQGGIMHAIGSGCDENQCGSFVQHRLLYACGRKSFGIRYSIYARGVRCGERSQVRTAHSLRVRFFAILC